MFKSIYKCLKLNRFESLKFKCLTLKATFPAVTLKQFGGLISKVLMRSTDRSSKLTNGVC